MFRYLEGRHKRVKRNNKCSFLSPFVFLWLGIDGGKETGSSCRIVFVQFSLKLRKKTKSFNFVLQIAQKSECDKNAQKIYQINVTSK